MKTLYPLMLLSLMGLFSISQEKPPEITDDYINIIAGDTVQINVMANDWCMEGHTMEIMNVWQGEGGLSALSDSTVKYTSFFYFGGVDTVKYILLDLNNNLMSDIGNLIIIVENFGSDNLDINNIDASLFSYGLQFCALPNHASRFLVPKGGNTHTIFNYSLWIGGKDPSGQLHTACERYRLMGEDFFPGPISENYLNSQYITWNKVWKINREEIEFHNENWWKSGYEPIENISSWPFRGDNFVGQADKLAPFIDHNNDGIYNPLHGDSPLLKGDQSIWLVYNDEMEIHDESDGGKLGFEIQLMAYAFDCPNDSIFDNTIFLEYTIINRSDTAYHDLYLGTFIDFDLGGAWDDYVGCDSSLNAFFAYNGDEFDENDLLYGGGYGYGYHPPVQGVVFLNQPLKGFIATNNTISIISDPSTPEGYYNILTSHWCGGEPLTYGGEGYGGETPVLFQYPGNPYNLEEWSEVSANNIPGDRRGIGSSGPFTILPGDTIHLDIAFIYARDYQGDNLSCIPLLKERIGQLRWYYDNDSTPCGSTWSSIKNNHQSNPVFSIFPNPCSEFLNCIIKNEENEKNFSYIVYDLYGKELLKGSGNPSNFRIPTSKLKHGIYFLRVSCQNEILTQKFVKK